MSKVTLYICDRCKKEVRCEGIEPWRAWKTDVSVAATGFGGQPDWIADFEWSGTLCVSCASSVDNAIRTAFYAPEVTP